MIRGLFVRKSQIARHKFFISNVKLWYNDENHFLTKEIIMDKLIDIIKGRKSVRTFDGKGLSDEDLTKLREYAEGIDEIFDVSVEYVFLEGGKDGLESPVLVGDRLFVAGKVPKMPYADVAFGYSFEKLVLYAWSLGIGTVWIGGTMKREAFEKAAGLKDGEMMPCITPVGYPAEKRSMREKLMRKSIKADSRKPEEELFFDGNFETPLDLKKASGGLSAGELADIFEMVRWAPSAVNKQPWRIVADGEIFHFYEKKDKGYVNEATGDLQKIDVGIALCHFTMGLDEIGKDYSVQISDSGISTDDSTEYIASVTLR